MKRIIPLLLSAALVFSLTACGGSASSASPASSEASSVASASSAAESEGNAEAGRSVLPLETCQITDPMADGIYSVSFEPEKLEDTEGGFVLQAVFYTYDQYDMVDLANLKPGDTLLYHDESGEELTLTVEKLETANGWVSINGGMESENGLDLLEEDTCYRTLIWDDYPIYYSMGEVQLPVADDAVLNDSSADVQAEPVVTSGAEAIFDAVQSSDGYWVCTNTTVRVEDGVIVEINRRWVP